MSLRKDLLHPLVVTALADPQRTSAFVLALAAWIAGGRDDGAAMTAITNALKNGTNPEHPDFWEFAPEGRSGEYVGVAQIPWFMTKFITGFYSVRATKLAFFQRSSRSASRP